MNNVSSSALAEIAEKSDTAESFFKYAASRDRNVRGGVSNIKDVRVQMAKEGYHPVAGDLLTLFKELERIGVGTLKDGKFKWNTPLKEIASLVTDSPRNSVAASILNQPSHILSVAESYTPKIEPQTLYFCFGAGREMSIKLFHGITRSEVEFITKKLLNEIA